MVTRDESIALIGISPSRGETRLALAFTVLLCAASLLIIPYAARPAARISGFVPAADAILLVGDLVAATLLLAQASVLGSRALAALGSGFVFTAVMMGAHALTFPGSVTPTGLLGAGPDTTAWIVVFWFAGLPGSVIAYSLLRGLDTNAGRLPFRSIQFVVCSTVLLAVALVALACLNRGLLPSLMTNDVVWNQATVSFVYALLATLVVVAITLVWRQRRSLLDLWLLVALAAMLAQMVLDLFSGGRYTVGWYFTRVVGLLEHLLVVLVLLAETSRMYTQSALSLVALKRERESRLMSMYAVATAMAHEVRQPLTGIRLQASAALQWLERPQPNSRAMAKSLAGIVEDTHRASDVVVGIRDVLAHQSGEQTDLDLNELVRDTVARMERELSAQKISLGLSLQETLPLIRADRVQLQEVLINLLTNAIDALRSTPVRRRKIAIRSSLSGHGNVLLEVSDSGVGVEAQQMDHMFDAFFTTKKHGTGMGLALCRSILEAHGGQLWASLREGAGLTMHLQLPKSVSPVS